jgi:phosphoenolpyruvate---glycerone phosphotransferase subunit DhaL
MPITAKDVAAFVDRAAAAIKANEAMLNEADGKLGDGDTGGMLARFAGAIAAADAGSASDVGSAFLALAKAGAQSTGSSFGTLLVTALMSFGKGTQGRTEIAWNEIGPLLAAARDVMMRRGNTELGAKTAIDSIDYVARALAEAKDAAEARRNAMQATKNALAEFRGRPCRMGRARMYADKSVDLDDPGMLAIDVIAQAVP